MSEIRLINKSMNSPEVHIVFVHGLNGDGTQTWQSLSETPVFWPSWLHQNDKRYSIWTIDYKADRTMWFGNSAMHITDRSKNILELLVKEKQFHSGEIAFVGHSMGGILIKKMMQLAVTQPSQFTTSIRFVERVKKVAFLATPHSGAKLAATAKAVSLFYRPSPATDSLILNDPNLRELNQWYRYWSHTNPIEHLVLAEGESTRIMGFIKSTIVRADSADPGLDVAPILVDEDHYSISMPRDIKSEVYVHLSIFLSPRTERTKENPVREIKNDAGNLSSDELDELNLLSDATKSLNAAKEAFEKRYSEIEQTKNESAVVELVDQQLEKELDVVVRSRFMGSFPAVDKATELGISIKSGRFARGSPHLKSKAIAWCARIQLGSKREHNAREFIELSVRLGRCQETLVAESFLRALDGGVETALSSLRTEDTPMARTAEFAIVNLFKGPAHAISWLKLANYDASDFDEDGQIILILALLGESDWDLLERCINSIDKGGNFSNPALHHVVALSQLTLAIPVEARLQPLRQLPINTAEYPLSSDTVSTSFRNDAIRNFELSSSKARDLDCIDFASLNDDFALWLKLRDEALSDAAIEVLKSNMQENSKIAIRRVPIAHSFGLDLDNDAVDALVSAESTRSAGMSWEAGVARFVLAHRRSSPDEALRYLEEHRAELERHIQPESLALFEIEVLIRGKRNTEALSLINSLSDTSVPNDTLNMFRQMIGSKNRSDEIAIYESQYLESESLFDLALLVSELQRSDFPDKFHRYADRLFSITGDVKDSERLVRAKVQLNLLDEVTDFLVANPGLIQHSAELRINWAWSLYREGRLTECKSALEELEGVRDGASLDALKVNLAISGGNWNSLVLFVEQEWQNRESRSAEQLFTASEIAQVVQLDRVRDLIVAATEKAEDDSRILSDAYFTAARMGWEDDDIAQGWLNTALNASQEHGAIKTVALHDLPDQIADMRQRDNEIWKKFLDGSCPTQIIASLLNRTLSDFYLFSALSNAKSNDLRDFVSIPAYSAVRGDVQVVIDQVSVDLPVLLTLSYLGLLQEFLDYFEQVTIPHSTLNWLFLEIQRVGFHQASRIKRAKEFLSLVEDKHIRSVERSSPKNVDLANEVGEELSCLFESAAEESPSMSYVVTSRPIHRAGSLMKEPARIDSHIEKVCSCSDLIRALIQGGSITLLEAREALIRLNTVDTTMELMPVFGDSLALFLDGIAIEHLLNAGVLSKIRHSEIEFKVHENEIARMRAYCEYEDSSNAAKGFLENIRTALATGLEAGNVKLAKQRSNGVNEDPAISQFLEISDSLDTESALFSDDRYLNSNKNITLDCGAVPVYTTLDFVSVLFSKGKIGRDKYHSLRSKLRFAGYHFIPVEFTELNYLLDQSGIADSELVETAELRAIRENIVQLQISNILLLPRDAHWLIATNKTLTQSLKMQWTNGDPKVSRARSNWLIRLIDYAGWAHLFEACGGAHIAESGPVHKVNVLILPYEELSADQKIDYMDWLEECVLAPLETSNPRAFAEVVAAARREIEAIIKRANTE